VGRARSPGYTACAYHFRLCVAVSLQLRLAATTKRLPCVSPQPRRVERLPCIEASTQPRREAPAHNVPLHNEALATIFRRRAGATRFGGGASTKRLPVVTTCRCIEASAQPRDVDTQKLQASASPQPKRLTTKNRGASCLRVVVATRLSCVDTRLHNRNVSPPAVVFEPPPSHKATAKTKGTRVRRATFRRFCTPVCPRVCAPTPGIKKYLTACVRGAIMPLTTQASLVRLECKVTVPPCLFRCCGSRVSKVPINGSRPRSRHKAGQYRGFNDSGNPATVHPLLDTPIPL
jgi:hypothetical protein